MTEREPEEQSRYAVFLVESLGAPRNHRAIFVEQDPEAASGHIFNVEGNIQNGMSYDSRAGERPENASTFLSKVQIGWIDSADLNRVQEVCFSIPPPMKQFDGPRRLFPREPLRRCQEWTREAIAALQSHGILQAVNIPASGA